MCKDNHCCVVVLGCVRESVGGITSATIRVATTSHKMPIEDVLLVEFTYLVFTRMPGESYRRRLRSLLLCLRDVFRALVNSLVC